MERSSKLTADFGIGRRRRASRSGKISIMTMFALLGMIVLAGYVGNVGHAVTAKLEAQNASDAVTFSSAQWMARGMNAVTATNHLIGEATGLVVAIEALGGPECDENMVDYPDVVKTIDTTNRTLVDSFVAPVSGLPIYGGTVFTGPDKAFLTVIYKIVSPEDSEQQKFHAFATIYDSKFTLKQEMLGLLTAKSIANAILFIPPPFGFATALPALAAHFVADIALIEVAKEYVLLEVMEKTLKLAKPIKNFSEKLLIALTDNADFIAAKGKSGVLNDSIDDGLKRLSNVYTVNASLFPAAKDLRLPIEPEPEPSMSGTQNNEQEWGKDEFPLIKRDDILGDLPASAKDADSKTNARISDLNKGITMLDGLNNNIIKQLATPNLSTEERGKMTNEQQAIAASRAEKVQRIKELKEAQEKENKQKTGLDSALKDVGGFTGGSGNGNISAGNIHLALDKMKQSEERFSQWTRASYPYVDSYRAPLITMFKNLATGIPMSRAAEFYTKWTNRYTLTNSWKFRSGFRFQRQDDTHGIWVKTATPMAMYVMKDAFAGTGNRKDQKGHEPWTADTTDGKQKAEQLFTMVGVTQHDKKTIFSPALYKRRTDDTITTFAQAILYNANEQRPDPIDAKTTVQALLGWDTLNWDPATRAPEWGAPAREGTAKWPWEVFTTNSVLTATAGVRLNWQAKLMPVTETRFEQTVDAPMANAKMTDQLNKAKPFFKQMVTH